MSLPRPCAEQCWAMLFALYHLYGRDLCLALARQYGMRAVYGWDELALLPYAEFYGR